MIALGMHLPIVPRVVRRLKRPWRQYQRRRQLAQQTLVVQQVAQRLATQGALPGLAAVRLSAVMVTRSDVVVALLAAPAASPQLVLKLPLTSAALRSLDHHQAVLAELNRHPALAALQTYLPQVLAWQPQATPPYLLETALPGVTAEVWLAQPERVARVIGEAASVIGQIHRATATWHTLDTARWEALIGEDLRWLQALAAHWPRARQSHQTLARIGARLEHAFVGRRLPLARVHGDLWPGNLLTQADGRLSGLLDWDRSVAADLPLLDVWHLLAYTRKLVRRSEMGQELLEYVLPARFSAVEQQLITAALTHLELDADPAWLPAVAWLYWLRFVAANLRRYPAFRRDATWLEQNVFVVLRRGEV